MPEQKIIKREFETPVKSKQAVEKILELAELAEKLLEMNSWKGKEFKSVQVILETPFHKPEVNREDSKHSLREVREYVIEFGTHAGSRLDDIPLSYLEYLYEAQKELNSILKFYLKHPSIKQERENE